MKTVQVVLDEALLRAADREARRERVNRSELFRVAMREYLKRKRIAVLEERERSGYARMPVKPGEFDVWDRVAEWPED